MSETVVVAGDEIIPTATKIWAAGVQVEHLSVWLGVDTDRVDWVGVNPDSTVPGLPNVSVTGDAAHIDWTDNKDVPGIAPVAKQMGNIRADGSASC